MTAQESQRRNERAESLKAIQISDTEYFVESAEGKIAYRVSVNNGERSCTCGDFASNIQRDSRFACKHIVAAVAGNGNVVRVEGLGNGRPRLNERFMMEIQGREFVKYSGVLDLAHQRGLRSIHVEVIQLPTKDNGLEAICKAVVESKAGDTFIEFGDANPKNTNQKIVNHILRMAATRAKARALRDFTNIGMTCLEELGDIDEVADNPKPDNGRPRKAPSKKAEDAEPKRQEGERRANDAASSQQAAAQEDKKKENAVPPSRPNDKTSRQTAGSRQQETPLKPSLAQFRAIENLSKRRGLSVEELEDLAQQQFGTSFENITATEASSFIRFLQQSA